MAISCLFCHCLQLNGRQQQDTSTALKAGKRAAAANGIHDHRNNGEDSDDGEYDDNTDDHPAVKRQRTASGSGRQQGGGNFYADTPEGTTYAACSFADLNLSRPLLRACSVLGYTQPTPIQVIYSGAGCGHGQEHMTFHRNDIRSTGSNLSIGMLLDSRWLLVFPYHVC